MRRYKLAVNILVTLFVFNFVPVLAAPVGGRQEEREAFADVVDGAEDAIIVSGKRAEEGEDPLTGYHGLTQASPVSVSQSVDFSASSERGLPGEVQRTPLPSGGTELPWYSPSEIAQRPSYPSGGTELPWHSPSEIAQRPSYPSGGTELPWQSSSEPIRRPSYASGGTEPLWRSSYNTGGGRPQLVQPETTSNIPAMKAKTINDNLMAASSLRTKPKIVQSMRTKTGKWAPTTESKPVLSSSSKITPASSSKVPPPLEQGGHLDQTPTKQPILQLESFLTDLASKSRLRPRIFTTASGAAQRELQGTVHSEVATF